MKHSRFAEGQIVHAPRQAEAGTPAVEIHRTLGVGEQTFSRWKRRFAGLGIADLRRLRPLEDENRTPKQLAADVSLDEHVPQEPLRTNRRGRPKDARWCASTGSASGSASGGRAGSPACRARAGGTAASPRTKRCSGSGSGIQWPAECAPATGGCTSCSGGNPGRLLPRRRGDWVTVSSSLMRWSAWLPTGQ